MAFSEDTFSLLIAYVVGNTKPEIIGADHDFHWLFDLSRQK